MADDEKRRKTFEQIRASELARGVSEDEAARKLMELLSKAGGSLPGSLGGSTSSTTTSSTPTGSGEALAGMGPESTQIVVPLIDGPGPFLGGNYMLTISIQRLH